jgi:hypothetical protein
MLTDEKTVLVACSNVPKHMGSTPDRQIPVEDSPPHEFRNHLSDWLAMMTEAAGIAAMVPEIARTPTKTDSDVSGAGTTTADAPRTSRREVAAKVSRS